VEGIAVRNRVTVQAAKKDPSRYGGLAEQNWGLMIRVAIQNLAAAQVEGLGFVDLMDIALDAMMADAKSYDPDRNDSFAHFIAMCIHSRINQAIDHRRRVNRRLRVLSFEDPVSSQGDRTLGDTISYHESGYDLLLERLSSGWRWGLIVPLLHELEPLERLVLKLYFWQDMTYRAIAEVIGGSHEWARKVRNRAIEKLRSALKERGQWPAE